MAVEPPPPYAFKPPVDKNSTLFPPAEKLSSRSHLSTSGKGFMDEEEFPQLLAAVAKPLISKRSSRQEKKGKFQNQKMLSAEIPPEGPQISTSSTISPTDLQSEVNEETLLENPADHINNNTINSSGPSTPLEDTADEQQPPRIFSPESHCVSPSSSLAPPIATSLVNCHKKAKKWQPLIIPRTIQARIPPSKKWLPAEEYYNSKYFRPKKARSQRIVPVPAMSTAEHGKPLKPENEPVNSLVSLPQIPVTNSNTITKAIPTSPSRKVTTMDPIAPVELSSDGPDIIGDFEDQSFLFKHPPRERPYFAMIQCKWEWISYCLNTNLECHYRTRCAFGHEEERYFDSPWKVQRFINGVNVDLWESRAESAGKHDLVRKRQELMGLADVINREGTKGGYRRLVAAERARMGLKPQNDEWCWGGRTYKVNECGSPIALAPRKVGRDLMELTATGASGSRIESSPIVDGNVRRKLFVKEHTITDSSSSTEDPFAVGNTRKLLGDSTQENNPQDIINIVEYHKESERKLWQQVEPHRYLQHRDEGFRNQMDARSILIEDLKAEHSRMQYQDHLTKQLLQRQYQEQFWANTQRPMQPLFHPTAVVSSIQIVPCNMPMIQLPPHPAAARNNIQTVLYNKPITQQQPPYPTAVIDSNIQTAPSKKHITQSIPQPAEIGRNIHTLPYNKPIARPLPGTIKITEQQPETQNHFSGPPGFPEPLYPRDHLVSVNFRDDSTPPFKFLPCSMGGNQICREDIRHAWGGHTHKCSEHYAKLFNGHN